MTTKQRVEQRAKDLGITIEREEPPAEFRGFDPIGQLVAPDGMRFGIAECHALTFPTWELAWADIKAYELEACPPDCDCREE